LIAVLVGAVRLITLNTELRYVVAPSLRERFTAKPLAEHFKAIEAHH
jgi:hypothetical protein